MTAWLPAYACGGGVFINCPDTGKREAFDCINCDWLGCQDTPCDCCPLVACDHPEAVGNDYGPEVEADT